MWLSARGLVFNFHGTVITTRSFADGGIRNLPENSTSNILKDAE
jgi:hypothetical protein